jgi:hypothetical protein
MALLRIMQVGCLAIVLPRRNEFEPQLVAANAEEEFNAWSSMTRSISCICHQLPARSGAHVGPVLIQYWSLIVGSTFGHGQFCSLDPFPSRFPALAARRRSASGGLIGPAHPRLDHVGETGEAVVDR